MSELQTHLIAYIDSDSRATGTPSSFSHLVQFPSKNTFDSVCVLQASIPKSYYLLTDGSNTFVLSEFGVTDQLVTLDVGNYSRRSLAVQVAAKLNQASIASGKNTSFTVTIPNPSTDADNGKYTFTANAMHAISLAFFSGQQPAAALGFDPNEVMVFTNGSLESSNVCRLQAKSTVFIKSDCTENGNTSVLQEIYSSVPDFSSITFQVGNAGGISANRKVLVKNATNSYDFVITDEDGVLLDTNGLGLTFSLLFWDSKRYQFTA
jgi:hypothetical protein